ncbi:MAG TPA: cardiolipin synthase [Labilithrix sp.]|nr:cardiolipin synthase [Labilithrix sp.]
MLVTLLTAAEIFYVVVLATWILFEKRPPVSTLAWILSLVALPYVGFVVFFFLGPRRLVRKRLRHRRARGKARAGGGLEPRVAQRAGSTLDDARFLQLERLAVGAGEPPADLCDEVEIFHDAASTYDAIESAIRAAKHHVHVAYYIFDSGRAGTRLASALMTRAKEGIVVRVLVDDVGSSAMKRSMIDAMRASGIKFARFHPVTFSRIRSRVDFRNHRKIVVCDGVVGFTGGINVCDDYVAEATDDGNHAATKRNRRGHRPPWRDTHVRLKGDAVRWLQLTFLDDWNYSTRYLPREPEYFPPEAGTGKHRVQIVASGPDRDAEPIQKLYFAAIGLAQKRVLVTTPYFVPDDAILTALTTAALRGVDVRILVPRRSDSLVVTAAARSYYDDVLAAGGRVYEYQPTMVHAKTLVVDDLLSSVGTVNMDNRSFRLNFEVTAILYGRDHADELAGQFERDLKNAKEIEKATRRQVTLRWRVAEAGARLLSPLL